MSEDPLHQLVYTSTYSAARIDNGLKALRDIVQVSKRNNAALGITGYLLFDGETFAQVLEGQRAAIEATYDRISRDARHQGAAVLGIKAVSARQFAAWTMAGYLRGPREAEIFRRHGVNGALAQAALDTEAMLSLMHDLAATQTAQAS